MTLIMESGNSDVVFMHVCCMLVVAWQRLYKGPCIYLETQMSCRGDHEIARVGRQLQP